MKFNGSEGRIMKRIKIMKLFFVFFVQQVVMVKPFQVIGWAHSIILMVMLLIISLTCTSLPFGGRTAAVGVAQASTFRHVVCSSSNAMIAGPDGNDATEFTNWSNPLYEAKDLNKLWNERDGLLTIGSNGVSQSHINSLSDLVSQHDIVRVKLATDKIDPFKVSDVFLSAEALTGRIDLLEVRRRGFMVRRSK